MIKGQRFELNLGPDDEGDARPQAPPAVFPGAFVTDVQERQVSQPKAPSAPTLRSKTGFPEHKKRNTTSRFRQKAQEKNEPPSEKSSQDVAQTQPPAKPSSSSGGNAKPKSWEEDEKQRIDDENRLKLAGMSEAEIEEERRELMNSMSPEFIQRLLKRSNIDSGSNESNLQPEAPPPAQEKPTEEKKPKEPKKSVKFADPEPAAPPPPSQQPSEKPTKDGEKDMRYVDDDPTPGDSIHFPQPPQPPDLDPNSSTFLTDLHEKYFPTLPADPDKLSWMQTSSSDRKAYSASASAFNAQEIRFAFTGEILAPTTSHAIPVTSGLHHHGAAPDAAGYTIPELAHLARSSYAAQRCIAFQTLGRILYRLGKGEFGNPGEPGEEVTGVEDSLGELARGLWGVVEHEKVIETLVAESEGLGVDGGRHLSARAYATEAVWLWRKGGGRRWKAA
ncbi:hypothetical protein D0869_15213 [Hortaea werneckii]|uniref:RNA polymerase II-associated protein 1 N-terminal domain-containing protein n=1 Tax=Hortaea werneckii TaxID=91943 RepID=A0A3M7AUP2_HORWE|nr:hypothetical protein KC334_g9978 [Hortaea werneckii]KAI7002552.1 hypothetical protein KC355_g9741 [Hortaea werneckii]KAI7585741.1 hypothetical protein KC316_g6002 [Hortaea werneckii]KAI7660981.1 hypothetical protein KC318_g9733 [Hortaea werneckii]RMX71849.1 hypothetical protein D0869_15213 [Hortaea werneckii]